jgi:hypothetical protein
MTEPELAALIRGIAPVIKDHVHQQSTDIIADVIVETIKRTMAPRDARIAALEAKVAAFEARGPGVDYKGTFTEGTSYPKGSLCTRGGGLWLALSDTTVSPGSGSNPGAWRLIVKSGGAER